MVVKERQDYHSGLLESPLVAVQCAAAEVQISLLGVLLPFLALAFAVLPQLQLEFALLPLFSIPACISGIGISWHTGSGHN